MLPGAVHPALHLNLRFAGILLVVLAPVVLLALDARQINAVSPPAPSSVAPLAGPDSSATLIGAGHGVTGTERIPAVLVIVGAALACWLVGVGLALLLVRHSVAHPLSIVLDVARGGGAGASPGAPCRAIPSDFEAIRRAVLAMREATEKREIAHHRTHADLVHLATSDAVTGIGNRHAFDAALASSWSRAVTADGSVALAIFDIDFFKSFNDRHGHLDGDRCLSEVAHVLRGLRVRDGDLAARLGGDEFALLLGGTDLAGAVAVADRALMAIRERMIAHEGGKGGIVTASVGVSACHPHPGLTPLSLFAAADAALYIAKANGRDRLATALGLAAPLAPAVQIRRVS
jgi:diguanylate cyclase (GGDEF)-like protein